MTWFIVVGRCWGDDEATAIKINARDEAEAREAFKEQMTDPWADKEPTGFAEGDGPGTVWIDQVFDCGDHEPTEV